MNKNILHKDVQAFIDSNLDTDSATIAFQKNPFSNVSTQELLEQIESKKRAKKKLPTWFDTKNIYYPPKKNLEQTSSEITAQYKSKLLKGKTAADLTGGFGVDSFYFSKQAAHVAYYEINESLSAIAAHNFKQLGVTNIKCIPEDGIVATKNNFYDTVYVDPSRRHSSKGKVFLLEDCLPDIVTHQDHISNHCQRLIVKTSPMLDISAGMKILKNVVEIHIIAVDNEVKELLWIVEKSGENCNVKTVNIKKENTETFKFDYDKSGVATYSEPKKYMYEPNAALLKSGAFDLLSERFSVQKLHQNTHLYTSEELVDFPGRRFIIENIIPYQKGILKKWTIQKANITTRNFPETVAQLKNKWKITDGGDIYLFFITDINEKRVVLQCRKN